MNHHTIIKVIVLSFLFAALSISVHPTDIGCCCNIISGEAQKFSTQSQADCDTQGGFTYTAITKLTPFDAATICTETCSSALPPPTFAEGALNCSDPLFKPPVKDLMVFPIRGSKDLRLDFNTVCPAQTNYFEISRCKGSTCTNFALLDRVPKDKGAYIDNDPTLLYNQDYTYRVVVNYAFKDGNSPPKTIVANPGDLECNNVLNDAAFCIGKDTVYYLTRFKDYLEANGYSPTSASSFKLDFDNAASDTFSLKLNTPWRCSNQNTLIKITPPGQCIGETRCVVRDLVPQCLSREDCKTPQPGTAFGLGFTIQNCERNLSSNLPRYCYFDRSASVANDCFNCRTDMSCYDYRTEPTCTRNNCGVGACSWKYIYPDIGIGVCRDTRVSNCFLCDLKGTTDTNLGGFNEIFDVCSPAKADALSVPNHPCRYQAASKTSSDCNAMTCRDYETGDVTSTERACATPSDGIKLDGNNIIISRSKDFCNLGVCHFDGRHCAKNADGKANLDKDLRDCIGKANEKECELDTIPPLISLTPVSTAAGKTDQILITRRDAFNRTMSTIKVQPSDYPVSFCTYPQGQAPCTTFSVSTVSDRFLIRNTLLEDVVDGTVRVLARLSPGINYMRYYSEDPNHNLGIINETSFAACDKCQGPTVIFTNISKGSLDSKESRFYTQDTQPNVTIHFDTPVTIIRAFFLRGGENAAAGTITDISSKSQSPSFTKFAITSLKAFTEGPLKLSVFGNDIGSGLAMDNPLEVNITIDTTPPRLEATLASPLDQTGFTQQAITSTLSVVHVPKPPIQIPFISASTIKFVLNFSEFIILDNVSVIAKNFTGFTSRPASINITTLFSSPFFAGPQLNKTFTFDNAVLPDGKNTLLVQAHDRARNLVTFTIPYAQAGSAPVVRLVQPPLGGAKTQRFPIEVESLAPAICRYTIFQSQIASSKSFFELKNFTLTGDTTHLVADEFLPRRDEEFPLLVKCRDAEARESETLFSLIFDETPPLFANGFPTASPEDIIEKDPYGKATTSLLVETDDATFCKFSTTPTDYDLMEEAFPGFNQTPLKIQRVDVIAEPYSQDRTTLFTYNVACKNRIGLGTGSRQVNFRVVPNVPFTVTSTTKTVFNQTPIFASAETNKRANCFFKETGSTFRMEDTGIASRSHRVQIQEESKNHTGTIECDPAGSSIGTIRDSLITIPVSFIVDLVNPIMQFVNDSSRLANLPDITVLTDRLLLSWYGTDIGSGINYYNITLKKLTPTGQSIIRNQLSRRYLNATYIIGLDLTDKTTYVASVFAVDHAGRESFPMDSNGVTTDFSLYPPHCSNTIQDPSTESDINCGGECIPCPEAKACNADADCQSLTCQGIGLGRTCQPNPTCTDQQHNGEETDIDCGGPCPGCAVTKKCILRSDCNNFNNANLTQDILTCKLGTCQAAQGCENLILNGQESDIDCGGSCDPCADGKRCLTSSDCKKETSTCDATFRIVLNATPQNPSGIRTLTLATSGEEPTMESLQALYGRNTTFGVTRQGGICINQVTDTDRDSMPDAYEDRHGLDKNNGNDAFLDNDKDTLTNLQEYQYFNTSKLAPPAGFGQVREIDPLRADTDADGFDDGEELAAKTNPLDKTSKPPFHDKDGDGISDDYELRYGLDPTTAFDRSLDPDNDGLTNLGEFEYTLSKGTLQENRDAAHPARELNPKGSILPSGIFSGFDTDNDGFSDKEEIDQKLDPLDPTIPPADLDSDNDGMPDRYERRHKLNPFDPKDAPLDPDKDNLTNLKEYTYFKDSTNIFGQAREIFPTVADTDADGFSDSQEIFVGTNPVDGKDPPASPIPPRIFLITPATGVSPTPTFDLKVGVDINSSCRFALAPQGTPAPTTYSRMQVFDTGANDLYQMSYQHVKNLKDLAPNTLFTLHVECIDGFRRSHRETFDLSIDPTPPTFTSPPSVFPNPVDEAPFIVELQATTDDETICKYHPNQASYATMTGFFPGTDTTPPQFNQGHSVEVTLPSAGTFSFFVACKNKAGLEGVAVQTPPITARSGASLTLTTTDPTPLLFNTGQVRMTVQTNKRSTCKFTEGGTTSSLSTVNGYSHVLQGFFQDGSHSGPTACTTLLGEQATQTRSFTVDSRPPLMESASFVPPDPQQPFVTFLSNELRATWKGADPTPGSGIKLFNITIKNETNHLVLTQQLTASSTIIPFTLELANLTRYTLSVSAVDDAGLASTPLASTIMVDFSKAPPHCINKIKDKDESGIDCGGSCNPCDDGISCTTNNDCASKFCHPTLKQCKPSSCTDTFKNGNETDVDCGGTSACPRCPLSKGCTVDGDCANTLRQDASKPVLVCGQDNTCITAPSCRNRVQDNGETDIDCGAVCSTSPCQSGSLCKTNLDCGKNLNCTTLGAPASQTNPLLSCTDLIIDTDKDGCPDYYEIRFDLDKTNANDCGLDPDKDGLTTFTEYTQFQKTGRLISPLLKDTDADGFSDGEEIVLSSNPVDPLSKPLFHDRDNDGMSDEFETQFGLNPDNPGDASYDSDVDGLTNLQEYQYFFNSTLVAPSCPPTKGRLIYPNESDTDKDTFSDREEVLLCYDPTSALSPSPTQDTDGDGMPDLYERKHRLNLSNPNDALLDPDKDGLSNLLEYQYYNITGREINPNIADTDADGFPDGAELRASTNPTNVSDPSLSGVTITLNKPLFGVASNQPFTMQIDTNINSTCRFWFNADTPPVPPPQSFTSLDQFDTTGALMHTKNALSGIKASDLFKDFPLFTVCIDAFSRQKTSSFNLSLDNTAPTITTAFSDPEPIAQQPLATTLTVATLHKSFCKYSRTSTEFNAMDDIFPGFNIEPLTLHNTQIIVPSIATHAFTVGCISPPGLGPTTTTITVHVDPQVPLSINRLTPGIIDTSRPTISVRTNKDAVCDFLKSGAVTRLGTGNLSRLHELVIPFAQDGIHNATVRCTTPSSVSLLGMSETVSVPFGYIIDTTPPQINYVLDDGPILSNPEISYFKDRLRLKFKGTDAASGIAQYTFKLLDASGKIIIDTTPIAEPSDYTFIQAPLIDKTRYVFTVTAKDYVGLSSFPFSSNGVTVDFGAMPSHCTNGIKDADIETDKDCGIECPPCGQGFVCSKDIECASGFCNIFVTPARCAQASCSDGFKNQNETDTDCGGIGGCGRCNEGKRCVLRSDCTGNLTCKTGTCTPPTGCENLLIDGSESDIDCGGTCTTKCQETKQCKSTDDCQNPLQCIADTANVKRCVDPGIDSDNDGIPDAYELRHGLNPASGTDASQDPDGDGLTTLQEYQYYKNSKATFNQTREIDPKVSDTDGDTFTDGEEILAGTNPIDPQSKPPPRDTDRDGMPDEYETLRGLNPKDPTDALRDFDADGLTTLKEYEFFRDTGRFLDPKKRDTDGDGFNDKIELDAGTDPTDPASKPPQIDTDGDGMPDTYELAHFLNPKDPTDANQDPDGDGLTSLTEYLYFSITGREVDPRLRDTDGDGFTDQQEILLGSNPVLASSKPTTTTLPADADKDGIPDDYEKRHGLNPADPTDSTKDPDADGLTNFQEYQYFLFSGREIDPQARDSDGDGYNDGQEFTLGYNPLDAKSKPSFPPDLDGDGMDDAYEKRHGLNPADPSDAGKDPDGDGLTTLEEYNYFTFTGREISPNKPDTDGDGFSDAIEIQQGSNPIDAASKPTLDSDRDGIPNAYELKYGLDPNDPTDAGKDKDGDGLSALQEFNYFLNTGREIDPTKKDTDGDGFSDKDEILLGFDPTKASSKPPPPPVDPANDKDKDGIADDWEARHTLNPGNASDASTDTDKDGLTALQEFQYFSVTGREIDPILADTDLDGFPDLHEILAGTNPLDPSSRPTSNVFIDSDNDGLPDDYESRHGLNPNDASDAKRDPDKDGLTNYQEFEYFRATGKEISPAKADTDGDGFTDKQEIQAFTNPIDRKSHPPLPDTDGDGLDEIYELRHGLNPNDATDALKDPDKDGLTNEEEYQYFKDTGRAIDPQLADTDNDGFSDKDEITFNTNPVDPRSFPTNVVMDKDKDGMADNWEIRNGLDPSDASDATKDPDKDNLTNLQEFIYFRDTGREISPAKNDTDSDGFTDKQEIDCSSNPIDAKIKCSGAPPSTDQDNDGIPDDYELRYGLNPRDGNDASKDLDGDGLTNLQEYQYYKNTGREINPTKADTDGDGYSDRQEIEATPPSNPIDAASKPEAVRPPPKPTKDRDGDGITDDYETAHGMDPDDRSDARQDPDGDSLNNLQEFRHYKNTGREIDPQKRDTDSDGFSDKEEIDANTNPIDPDSHPVRPGQDSDSDGIPDDYEKRYGLDPNDPMDATGDPDNDGLTTKDEYDYFKRNGKEINPRDADTDHDAYTDKEEIDQGFDPTNAVSHPIKDPAGIDTDKDGIPDQYEVTYNLNPNDPSDALLDPDGDGMHTKAEYDYFRSTGHEISPQKFDTDGDGASDKDEIASGTNPTDPTSRPPAVVTPPPTVTDTDGDGIPDDYETSHGLDPNDPSDADADPDDDKLTNREEYAYYTRTNKLIDPQNADTDGDGATDKYEIDNGTDPTDKSVFPSDIDTDGDGMPDVWEIRHGLDANDPSDAPSDPSASGLTNLQKYEYYKLTGKDLDPFKADSDGDGFSDSIEIAAKTDPTNPQDHPTRTWLAILLILALLALVSIGSYAGYRAYQQHQQVKPSKPPPKSAIPGAIPPIGAMPKLPPKPPAGIPPESTTPEFKELSALTERLKKDITPTKEAPKPAQPLVKPGEKPTGKPGLEALRAIAGSAKKEGITISTTTTGPGAAKEERQKIFEQLRRTISQPRAPLTPKPARRKPASTSKKPSKKPAKATPTKQAPTPSPKPGAPSAKPAKTPSSRPATPSAKPAKAHSPKPAPSSTTPSPTQPQNNPSNSTAPKKASKKTMTP